jgi:hypothetical protein
MGIRPLLRLLVLAALAALVVLPGAAAERGPRATDGTLAIRDGNGVFQLAVRGSLVGRVEDAERLVVVDPNPFDRRRPVVRGWEDRRRLGPRKVVFEGDDLRLRSARGFFRFTIVGTGVNLSMVGVGSVTMKGDESFADTGVYSLNGAEFLAVPYERVTIQVGAPGGE